MSDNRISKHQIKTFTGGYNLEEDRISLSIRDSYDGKQVMLFTRRLMERFVVALAEIIEKNAVHQEMYRDVQLSMATERARQDRLDGESQKQAVVIPDVQTFSWLCKRIDFREQGNVVVLVFSDKQNIEAAIALNRDGLLNFLDILYTLFQRAQWLASCFPAWIGQETEVSYEYNSPTLN